MSGLATLARRLNIRYLTRRRLRAALTLAGIAAGVALVFATTIINASVTESVRRSVRELAGDADLEVAASSPAGLTDSFAQEVEGHDGVGTAAPVLRSITSAMSEGDEQPLLVMGITPAFLTVLQSHASDGVEFSGAFGSGGIVLSRDVAAVLHADVGEVVTIATPSGRREVAVTGVMAGGQLETVNGGMVGVMPLAAAQALFERPGAVDTIYIAVDRRATVATVQERLAHTVGAAATVGRPEDRLDSLTEGYSVVAAMLTLTGWIALAVAFLVVHNTMAMAVADRRRELAVALSLGATRRQILGAFVAEGAVLGLVGAVVGMVLGLGLAKLLVTDAASVANEVLPLAPHPVLMVSGSAVAVAVMGGVVVAALGAGTAARRVTAVAPIEALRPAAAHEPLSTQPVARRTNVAAGALLAAAVVTGVVAIVGDVQQMWLVTAWLLMWMAGFGLLMPWFSSKAVQWLRPALRRVAGPTGRLAGDALARNPGRTAAAAASLTLTLGMVIALATPLRAFEADLHRRLDHGFGADLYLSRGHVPKKQPLGRQLEHEIAAIDGVERVGSERDVYVTIGGDVALAIVEPASDIIGYRDGVSSLGDDEIAISRLLAERLGLDKGDDLMLPTPRGEQHFTIAAVYQQWATVPTLSIPTDTYVHYWGDRTVDVFNVYVARGADVEQVRQGLEELVGVAGLDANVLTKDETIDGVIESFRGLLAMADGTLLIALVIAALTIANTAFATILERRWELGMVQTLGMTRRGVARMLLIEVTVVAVIGGTGALVVGTATGLGITKAVSQIYALSIPFRPPLPMLAVVLGAGVIVTAAATVLPRRLATRAPLIESLRFD